MKTIALLTAALPTIIAILAIVLILFFAIRYIYREKKKGNKCIGCPYSDSCPKSHSDGGPGCNCG